MPCLKFTARRFLLILRWSVQHGKPFRMPNCLGVILRNWNIDTKQWRNWQTQKPNTMKFFRFVKMYRTYFKAFQERALRKPIVYGQFIQVLHPNGFHLFWFSFPSQLFQPKSRKFLRIEQNQFSSTQDDASLTVALGAEDSNCLFQVLIPTRINNHGTMLWIHF